MSLLKQLFGKAEERREAPRVPVMDSLFIESISSDQISPIEKSMAKTINVSRTGMQVELDLPVLEDTEIALWISDDGGRSLISGIVRWVRESNDKPGPAKYLIGIELDAESAPRVEQWLQRR